MKRGCPVHGRTECSCDLAYKVWSAVMQLPSYGLLGNGDIMISRKAAIEAVRLVSDSDLHDAIARLESRSFAANKRLDRLERSRKRAEMRGAKR